MMESVTRNADEIFRDTLASVQKLEIEYKNAENPMISANKCVEIYNKIDFLISHASPEAMAYILKIIFKRNMGVIKSLDLLSELQEAHKKDLMQFMIVLIRSIERNNQEGKE